MSQPRDAPGSDDARSQRERMLAGELYLADDPEISAESRRARRLQDGFKRCTPEEHHSKGQFLGGLLGSVGPGTVIWAPFF